LLLAIVTETDTRLAWLRTGEVLSQLLLKATNHGLAASFLNQAIEMKAHRKSLAALLGTVGFLQILLRIGYPDRLVTSPTPRRAVDEVTFD
jgi:hypothetical protein